MATFDYAVKYNGKIYPAGEEVEMPPQEPVKETPTEDAPVTEEKADTKKPRRKVS